MKNGRSSLIGFVTWMFIHSDLIVLRKSLMSRWQDEEHSGSNFIFLCSFVLRDFPLSSILFSLFLSYAIIKKKISDSVKSLGWKKGGEIKKERERLWEQQRRISWWKKEQEEGKLAGKSFVTLRFAEFKSSSLGDQSREWSRIRQMEEDALGAISGKD